MSAAQNGTSRPGRAVALPSAESVTCVITSRASRPSVRHRREGERSARGRIVRALALVVVLGLLGLTQFRTGPADAAVTPGSGSTTFGITYLGSSQASLTPGPTQWYADSWSGITGGTVVVGPEVVAMSWAYMSAAGGSELEDFVNGAGAVNYFHFWGEGVDQNGNSVVFEAEGAGTYARFGQELTFEATGPGKVCDGAVWWCLPSSSYLASSPVTFEVTAHVAELGLLSDCASFTCLVTGTYTQTDTEEPWPQEIVPLPHKPSEIPRSEGQKTVFYTGGAQVFTVPPGVTALHVDAHAPRSARGGRTRGDLGVAPGETLWVYVGGVGGSESSSSATGGAGGFNGGGKGGTGVGVRNGGRGGSGATDVRKDGVSLSNRVVVAGGSGGGSQYYNGSFYVCSSFDGWAGGGLSGAPTGTSWPEDGRGGTQTSGGAGGSPNASGATSGGWGFSASGGAGGNGSSGGGGGGGGFYGGGGGGGGGTTCSNLAGWGGGGSGYAHPALVGNPVHSVGGSEGQRVRLSWTAPIPTALTVSPPTQHKDVGTSAALAARVVDEAGAPVWGIPVTFERQGAHEGTSIVATDQDGVAVLTYVGTEAGTDTVTLSAEGLPSVTAVATVVWEESPATTVPPTTLPPTTVPPTTGGAGLGHLEGTMSFDGGGLPPPNDPCAWLNYAVEASGEANVAHSALTAFSGPVSVQGSGWSSCANVASGDGPIWLSVSGTAASGASLVCPELIGPFQQRFGVWRATASGDCNLNGLSIGPTSLTLIGRLVLPGSAIEEPTAEAAIEAIALLYEEVEP